jgi:hypothetical protein
VADEYTDNLSLELTTTKVGMGARGDALVNDSTTKTTTPTSNNVIARPTRARIITRIAERP